MADPHHQEDARAATAQRDRRLHRERQARQEAERIAEDATRRLYREQIKLATILEVTRLANASDSLEDTTAQGLQQLAAHTVWKRGHALYRNPEGHLRRIAELNLPAQDGAIEPTPAGRVLLDSASGIESQLGLAAQSPNDPVRCCICSIYVHGHCYGLIEAFADTPDIDPDLSREVIEGIAQALGHVYKREHDRKVIEHMAYFDGLTGLGNRALFFDRLDLALRRARRAEQCVAVLALNIDRFRDINDMVGKQAGDQFLVALANSLRTVIRDTDTAARIGGDEFVVVFDGVDSSMDVEGLCQRVLNALYRDYSAHVPEGFDPHMSAGVAVFPGDAHDAEVLTRCAEMALQRSKGEGGARLTVYDPALAERSARRRELEQELRTAVANGELVPWFQPIVDLPSQRIVGAEALLRWQRPGAPGPDQFVPILEELGLMLDVGDLVLNTALQQAADWRASGHDFQRISVNVSPVQLKRDHFLTVLDRALSETALPADCVCLEITENVYLAGDSSIRARIAAVRERGVHIALDDFGTGYSSLGYLQWLRLDTLKIDKSFVQPLGQDPYYTNLVRSIISLAQALDLQVTAEGIEHPDAADMLAAMGCTYCQGYYFGRAMQADALTPLLPKSC
ncbi:bifunctional diguanylate cyclase/phosphodiesterase [Thioalkalivibrio sp. ALJ3]|uniref:putative bifunctional diguanylate cyclase/phosphodiesterase n=1 Tax=Thioalkalivibrio sp. ALJ3 TaxID=1240557 RepID=UPI00035DA805|nr:bifunctional diguanylate cyclase/phosphodiesterase [Thioalkalivibrio sp. ALJ3]